MIARRDVLKWGALAPAVAGVSQAAFARSPQGLDAFMLDTRYVDSLPAEHAGIPAIRFAGDVTKPWFDTLDPAWRQRGYVLGGITGSDALFVLETLAQQHGRRVVSQTQLGEKNDRGVAPVSWVIAPVHPSVMA